MTAGNANATGQGGVSAKQVRLGEANDNAVLDWQQGLDDEQIARVEDHRRTRPSDPLPAKMLADLLFWRPAILRLALIILLIKKALLELWQMELFLILHQPPIVKYLFQIQPLQLLTDYW